MRGLMVPVFLPVLLESAGVAAIFPFIPLLAVELGAGFAGAGAAFALHGLGGMVIAVPIGLACARFGEKRLQASAGVALAGCCAGIALVDAASAFGALLLGIGACHGAWMLARLAWMSRAASPQLRGRALATTGGVTRIGSLIGPIAGGFIGDRFGLQAIFVVPIVLALVASALMMRLMPSFPPQGIAAVAGRRGGALGGLWRELRSGRRILTTAGAAMVALSVLRTSRRLIVPLWGAYIGLDVVEIGLVAGLTAGMEIVMFLPAGIVMDRFGRRFASAPATLLLAVGLAATPLTQSFAALLAVGLIGAVGNGLGSGINMTYGADLAPAGRTGQFLGLWRLISDIGSVVGPTVAGVAAAALSLAGSALAVGVLGLAGAVAFALLPEPAEQRRRADAAAGDG
ncbi:MAG: MFS transporter [Spirochaetaceae bacterium]|nr:MFS transporter [Spirochaetaceae bacterium]